METLMVHHLRLRATDAGPAARWIEAAVAARAGAAAETAAADPG